MSRARETANFLDDPQSSKSVQAEKKHTHIPDQSQGEGYCDFATLCKPTRYETLSSGERHQGLCPIAGPGLEREVFTCFRASENHYSGYSKTIAWFVDYDSTFLQKLIQDQSGMFLLARLIMDNLVDQDCRQDLEEELNDEVLPNGIGQA